VTFPDLSVGEGLRMFLTGGMALPPRIRSRDESAERAPGSFS
jgi:hypothetical protein